MNKYVQVGYVSIDTSPIIGEKVFRWEVVSFFSFLSGNNFKWLPQRWHRTERNTNIPFAYCIKLHFSQYLTEILDLR